MEAPHATFALGIDAGGSETRWALADGAGTIVAEGRAAGFSAHQVLGAGRERVLAALAELAREVLGAGRPHCAHAGMTGAGPGSAELARLLAGPLGLAEDAVTLGSDIETAYLDAFEPGGGYLVYAGTGSFSAFLDEQGLLHRAGGRGNLIDDGGGGFWIAREALRLVWRIEDERPGAWRDSPLAQELFEQIGGPDWASTRRYVYEGGRGEVGRLALAVARAAERDASAADILRRAGMELARLAQAMTGRYGPRPVALAGGAASLHSRIAEAMREALPSATECTIRTCAGHCAAARIALRLRQGSYRLAMESET